MRWSNWSRLTAPYTYTTHPTVELHIHSGRALISSLLSSLALLPNLRPAEPGEFTRQAFLGGRLDLTQVEGLHDLIEADTEVQRVWALGTAGVSTLFDQNCKFLKFYTLGRNKSTIWRLTKEDYTLLGTSRGSNRLWRGRGHRGRCLRTWYALSRSRNV